MHRLERLFLVQEIRSSPQNPSVLSHSTVGPIVEDTTAFDFTTPRLAELVRENPALRGLFILTLMLCPQDLDSVESFIGMALTTRSYSKLLRDTGIKFANAAPGGSIAGEVFLHLLQLKSHMPEHASVGKATFLVSRDLEGKKLRDGKSASSHIDRVHACWSKFRRVAHFWAALRLELDGGEDLLRSGVSEADIISRVDKILVVADALLLAAIGAGIAFDPNPWRWPANSQHVCTVQVPPPTSEAVALLKSYRAPKRPK